MSFIWSCISRKKICKKRHFSLKNKTKIESSRIQLLLNGQMVSDIIGKDLKQLSLILFTLCQSYKSYTTQIKRT
ncbi:hypothetical protein Bca4012_020147 [Brassica carinata]